MNDLRWILLGVGVIVIALIYLWGMRGAIRDRLREQRRRAAARLPENEPVLGKDQDMAESGSNEFGAVRDPLAHRRLVDVEISPVRRVSPQPNKAEAVPSAELGADAKAAAEPTTTPAEKPVHEAAPMPVDKPAAHKPAAKSKSAGKSSKGRSEPKMTMLLTVIPHQGRVFSGQRILAVAQELDLRLGDEGLFHCFPDAEAEDQRRSVFGVGHLREPGTFDPETIKALSTPGLLLFMHLPGPVEGLVALELIVAMAGKLADKLGGVVCDDRRKKMTNQEMLHLRSEIIEFERRRRVWTHQQHA